eukprot:1140332-Pelagomonas_calceolata.AAC.2
MAIAHVQARWQHWSPPFSSVLKRNDAGGAQMLTIHAEADVLEDNSRPLHLKKFNVAWIGEPKLPLNELAKAR